MRIIAGAYKGRVLRTVTGPGYRPAMSKVRESLFSLLEARGAVWRESRVLDLFAGSGSLGFEALSRGASQAVFVEKDPSAAACLQKNISTLDVGDRASVLLDDVLKYATRRPSTTYHTVFIDPPYAENLMPPTLRSLVRRGWLEPNAFVVAEVEKHLKLNPEGFDGLTLELDRQYGQTRILIWVREE